MRESSDGSKGSVVGGHRSWNLERALRRRGDKRYARRPDELSILSILKPPARTVVPDSNATWCNRHTHLLHTAPTRMIFSRRIQTLRTSQHQILHSKEHEIKVGTMRQKE